MTPAALKILSALVHVLGAFALFYGLYAIGAIPTFWIGVGVYAIYISRIIEKDAGK